MRTLALVVVVLVAGCEGKKVPTLEGAPSSAAPVVPRTSAAAPTSAPVGSPVAAASVAAPPVAAPSATAPAPAVADATNGAPTALAAGATGEPSKPGAIGEGELRAIEGALHKLLETEVEVSQPVINEEDRRADPSSGRQVYVLYEHAAVADCEGCPTAEELAQNPGCKAYGMASAKLGQGEPAVVALPMKEVSCELEVLQWFVGQHQDDSEFVLFEGVASKVVERRGKKGKPVTRSRHHRLVVWTDPSAHEDGIATEALALEVDRWQVQQGARERPVRNSAFIHTVFGRAVVVQLLPCYDPWADEACDDYIRKRVVHEL